MHSHLRGLFSQHNVQHMQGFMRHFCLPPAQELLQILHVGPRRQLQDHAVGLRSRGAAQPGEGRTQQEGSLSQSSQSAEAQHVSKRGVKSLYVSQTRVYPKRRKRFIGFMETSCFCASGQAVLKKHSMQARGPDSTALQLHSQEGQLRCLTGCLGPACRPRLGAQW